MRSGLVQAHCPPSPFIVFNARMFFSYLTFPKGFILLNLTFYCGMAMDRLTCQTSNAKTLSVSFNYG